MEKYASHKDRILAINKDFAALLTRAGNMAEGRDHALDTWQGASREIGRQLTEETLRVAVVGPIKSGKSTFLNAFLGGDFLKTGAGVMTSIVTRIRRGDLLRARLFFKSPEEINQEINQALVLMSPPGRDIPAHGFDIERPADRQQLGDWLASLPREQLITGDARNINTVVLASYLKGYDTAAPMIAAAAGQGRTLEYAGARFHEHRRFTGDEVLAVFLKDVLLEVDAGGLEQNLELADCQGSDAPNPLHLAMIQDYLQLTHLIVYVISSRTGLRQADIRFLTMIRDMGLMESVLFLVNVDFDEHASREDLERLVAKVREELALVHPDPVVYAFSSLVNLFGARRTDLSARDALRLDQWESDTGLARLSGDETRRFLADFERQLTQGRYVLLLRNHLERLALMNAGLAKWLAVHRQFLDRDKSAARQMARQMKDQQQKIDRVKQMIRHTLDGSLQRLKQELRHDADRFFDPRSGEMVRHLKTFIRNYAVGTEGYEKMLTEAGFSGTVYFVFQEFKQALDGYMAEAVNPRIIRFTREAEQKIADHLASTAGSFEAMLQQALSDYNRSLESMGIGALPAAGMEAGPGGSALAAGIHLPPMASIREAAGLALPPAAATMRYSGRLRTEALMRLGVYAVIHALKRLVRRKAHHRQANELKALRHSVARMKKETEKSVDFHLKDFRENVKFQYLLKLADLAADTFFQTLVSRMEAYATDLAAVAGRLESSRLDQDQLMGELAALETAADDLRQRIETLRARVLAA